MGSASSSSTTSSSRCVPTDVSAGATTIGHGRPPAGWPARRPDRPAPRRARPRSARPQRHAVRREAQTCTARPSADGPARHRHGLLGGRAGRDEIGATRMEVADPYSAGKARLLGWTASALRCRAVLHQLGGGRVGAVTVFGFASDRERVEVLFTSLLLQAGRSCCGSGRRTRASRWRRTGGRGCTGSRCRCTGGSSMPNAGPNAGRERRPRSGAGPPAGRGCARCGARARRSAQPGRARLRRGVPRAWAAAGGRCCRAPGSRRARPRASAPTWVRRAARAPRTWGVTRPAAGPSRPAGAGDAVATGLRIAALTSPSRRATRRRRPVADRGRTGRSTRRTRSPRSGARA